MISVPISYGELFDKISILEIKLLNIQDNKLIRHVEYELSMLEVLCIKTLNLDYKHEPEYCRLKKINQLLWNICDERRKLEKEADFSDRYIKLSRLEYTTNDDRARSKLKLNQKYDSQIFEVKSYEWFKS